MEDIPWYSDATLFTDSRLRCAGMLVQCLRKWGLLSAADQPDAHIKLSVTVYGKHRLDADKIAALKNSPGYLNALKETTHGSQSEEVQKESQEGR